MQSIIQRENDDKLDVLEALMLAEFPEIECPLEHVFAKGMYVRSILMFNGMAVTSKIHKTCHPYIVSKGEVSVSVDGQGAILIRAPYIGVTQAGTRRVLLIHEDVIWTTVHRIDWITGDENDLSEEEKLKIVKRIEDEILEPHENKFVDYKTKTICHS